jgi:hypothetical protein
MTTKKLKFRTPAVDFGTKQHIMLHKLAEKGCHHAFIVNNIEDIKNPLTCEIPIIYMKNGTLEHHYTWSKTGDPGMMAAEHSFAIKFQKISAYFIRGGILQFDGDKFAPKDRNLKMLARKVEAIGYENI